MRYWVGGSLKCRNCPYIREDFDRRMNWHNKFYNNAKRIDYKGNLELSEDYAKEVEESCYCEKTGGKIWWYGQCEDAYSDIPKHENRAKKKRRNKRERDLKYKNHLKYLTENTSDYPSPAMYMDEIWVKGHGYVKNLKPYYKRLYRSKRSKYLKRQSNKKIRRYKGELHNGWHCHRLYDFWWKYC